MTSLDQNVKFPRLRLHRVTVVCVAIAVGLSSCGSATRQALRVGGAGAPTVATTSPPTAVAGPGALHPAFSALGLAILAGGDQLNTPVDTFGTLHFEPPDPGSLPAITKAAALQAVPGGLMPNKDVGAHAKLATWVDGSQVKLQPSGGKVQRVLVWLIVEPSMPGIQPAGRCCFSASDQQQQAQYYSNWPIDILAMVDASTGRLIGGVMEYGVQ